MITVWERQFALQSSRPKESSKYFSTVTTELEILLIESLKQDGEFKRRNLCFQK